jgi:8-amino-7-oxononanoate synthase
MSLESRWQAELEQLRAVGRYRQLSPPAGIDFSSNDYLGYGRARGASQGRDTPPACAEDSARSGTASRLLRGHRPIWDEVEATLAQWHGEDTALMFPSGYTANEGLLSTVIGPDDWVASDQFNHASIIDGLRLSRARRFIYRHNDLAQLENGLSEAAANWSERFIVTESLFGMEGDRAPLADVAQLAKRYGAHLIVDEAHATGCFGPAGSGLVDAAGLRRHVLATVHTGGKALGVLGAYVVGSATLKDLLVNRCRHVIFTTALPPVVGQWWLHMLTEIADDQGTRSRLHRAAKAFRAILREHGIEAGGTDYIVSLVLRDDARAVAAAQRLQEAGYDIRAIRPPTVPEGAARLRISIHADHERDLLRQLASDLAQIVHADRALAVSPP